MWNSFESSTAALESGGSYVLVSSSNTVAGLRVETHDVLASMLQKLGLRRTLSLEDRIAGRTLYDPPCGDSLVAHRSRSCPYLSEARLVTDDLTEELLAKIKTLNELVWERRLSEPDIQEWQMNFKGGALPQASEHLHALHLLAHLTYFGLREIRALLRCMFRDYVRGPILRDLRASNPEFLIRSDFEQELDRELRRTRFVGMGNPAESGTHLLYYFRQEAQLPKDLFVHPHELFNGEAGSPTTRLADRDLRRIVFVDDVCGSGSQSISYSRNLLPQIRSVAARSNQDLHISYLVLLGARDGIQLAREQSSFDSVNCVSEMDDSFATYSTDSRVFASAPAGIEKSDSLDMARHYGECLNLRLPWGLGVGSYCWPSTTMSRRYASIIWSDGGEHQWTALMKRLAKIY